MLIKELTKHLSKKRKLPPLFALYLSCYSIRWKQFTLSKLEKNPEILVQMMGNFKFENEPLIKGIEIENLDTSKKIEIEDL